MIYVKNFKFINGCTANNDTHKTAKIFLTSNILGAYSIAIDLRNSLMALHAKSCLILTNCYVSDSFEMQSKAYGFMQHPTKYQAYVEGLFRSRQKTLKQSTS